MLPSDKVRSVPRTWKTSHGSTFKTAGQDDRDNVESGVKTETVWETMDPYTKNTRDSISTTIPTSSSTRIIARPDIPTKSNTDYPTATPEGSQSPDSLASTPNHSRRLSDGAIAAVVIGVVVGLALATLAAWLLMRKRRRRPTISNPILPREPELCSPPPPSSPLPTPPLLSELSAHPDRNSTLEDSWVSYGDRVRSPTPQPAVAEVKSFTRAWQKPRVYTVGGRRIAELPGSQPQTSLDDESDEEGGISPIPPASRASSAQADRRVVSPTSLTSRFSTLSSRTNLSRERG
ncbi:hypothetical protein ACHAPI_005438 [Fusarium lateritium]